MQILIVGRTAKEYALAKKIKQNNPDAIVFIAPGNQAVGNEATCIDIQPDNIKEIVEFAQANEINMTIVTDDDAINVGLTNALNEEGLMVFGPDKDAAKFAISKAAAKRFMYRLQIPTPKFGIFDKESSLRDYVKNASYPLLLKTDKHEAGENNHLCHSAREANNIINKLYMTDTPKTVIESYVKGREFSFYVFTDGYNALPICAVVPYKYSSEKDGGSITKGVGAYAPACFIDDAIVRQILGTVIYPILSELENNDSPYVGILGTDIILDSDNNFNVIEFNTFFKEPDIECIMEIIDEDILNLFQACTVGSLSDDYEFLNTKNKAAISVVLTKIPEYLFDNETSEVMGLEELDDDININYYNAINKNDKILAKAGRVISLTTSASTLRKAKAHLNENISAVNFKGKHYRKDILTTENDY